MHISEGVLSSPVLMAGAVGCVAGLGIGLRRLEAEQIPMVALLSSTFFLASLIHVPVGPTSVHLILNGFCGLLLGWYAFPAIFIGVALHAMLFQFGGFTTLGVNTCTMAVPAVACGFLFHSMVMSEKRIIQVVSAFACGACPVLLSALMVACALVTTGEAFTEVAYVAVLAHLPVMVIEGFISLTCVCFLRKVRPKILEAAYAS
ncbi:MAG: cobalt transporter CbiM [Pseudomonadota bacterium]